MNLTRPLLTLSALSLCACLSTADERAEFDTTIGQYSSQFFEVRTRDGLGHIRAATNDSVTLWAQAPTIEITLTPRDAFEGSLTLTLDNAMNDAVLSITDDQNNTVSFDALPTPRPTTKTYRLQPQPNTTYTLRITPPDAEDPSPYTFVVFADIQRALTDVREFYAPMHFYPEIRFGLISGDLTSQGTPDELRRFRNELQTLPFPCFATLGNHELGTEDLLFQKNYGRANFHFTYRSTHFTMIDSASATIAPRVYGWLDSWLDEGRGSLHYVSMHVPPLDPAGNRNGAFASRSEANLLISKLARADVDTAVYGHVHSFYAYEHAEVPAFISGGGGAIPERLDGIGRHFLLMRANPQLQVFDPTVIRIDAADSINP